MSTVGYACHCRAKQYGFFGKILEHCHMLILGENRKTFKVPSSSLLKYGLFQQTAGIIQVDPGILP
jgi:hypothetical protein